MAAASLIPWKTVEADPRWSEAPAYLRDEYLSKWEAANLQRLEEAGGDVELSERIKGHAASIRSELYPSEATLSTRTKQAAAAALAGGATAEDIIANVPPSRVGDVASAIGEMAAKVRQQRRQVVTDLNNEFTKQGRQHRVRLTEGNGDGVLRLQAPVTPGTEGYDDPQFDVPADVDEAVEKAANKLRGYNLQLMRMGVFKQPSGITEEFRDLPFMSTIGAQLGGGVSMQAAGVMGMLRDLFTPAGTKPSDLEAGMAHFGQILKEVAGAKEGVTGSLARGAGTVGSLVGPGGVVAGALRAASEAYETTLVTTGSNSEARAAALKTAPAMLLFLGSGKFLGNMTSKLAGPDASALTQGLLSSAGATVSNIGVSSVLRALEAEEGEALQAAKPTIETLTVDTLFAAMHGFGAYSKVKDNARARAEAELKRRGFTQDQFKEWYFANMKRAKGKVVGEEPPEPPETPAEQVVPPGTPPPAPAPAAPAPTPPTQQPRPPAPAAAPTPGPVTADQLRSTITTLEEQLKNEVATFGESETSAALRSVLDASINRLAEPPAAETPTTTTAPDVVSESQQVAPTPEPPAVETPQPAGAAETPAPAAPVKAASATVEGAGGGKVTAAKFSKEPNFEAEGVWKATLPDGRTFRLYRDPDNKWWYEADKPGHFSEHALSTENREDAVRRWLEKNKAPTQKSPTEEEPAKPDINDIVPAVPIMGELVRGKPGQTHRQILDQWKAGKTDEQQALAEMDFDTKSNANRFVVVKDGAVVNPDVSREQLEKWYDVRSSQELAKKQEEAAAAKKAAEQPPAPTPESTPPAAEQPPPPAPRSQDVANMESRLDAQRSRLERVADYRGGDIEGFDAELAAAKAITDVLATIKPDATDQEIVSATTNRVHQIVQDMRRAANAAKRGGGETPASIDDPEGKASQVPDVSPESKPADKQAEKNELSDAIADEANKMDLRDRTILFGMQEGQSLNEIAKSLGISATAVQNRWKKIRTKMQQRLAKFKEAGALLNPLGAAFARGRQPEPTVTAGSILVEPYQMGGVMRRFMRGWLGKFGSFPPEMRAALQRGGYAEQALTQRFKTLAADLSAALDEYAGKDQAKREAAMDLVAQYEEGNAAALNRLPTQRLRDTALQNRVAMDQVTEALVDEGAVPVGPLANAMISNVGAWMRRYYAAFDAESGWTLDSLRERAAGSGPDAAKAKKIIDDAELFIYQDLTRRYLPNTPAHIEAVMRGLTDRSELQAAIFGGPSNMKADISSFVKRQTIPKEIRALMGEEKNPILRIEKSGGFLSQAITRHRMQQELRSIGLQAGVFSLQKVGRFAVEVPSETPGRSPWRGLYTTPEFAAAMAEAQVYGEGVGTATKLMDKIFRSIVGEVKFNLVALNPRSWIPNAAGGGMQSVFNGVFTPLPGTGAPIIKTLVRSYRAIARGDKPFDPTLANKDINNAARNLYYQLQSQGLVDSSVTLQDWESSVSDGLNLANATEKTLDRVLGAARGAITGYSSGLASSGSPLGGAVGAVVGTMGGAALGSQKMTKIQRRWGQFIIGSPDSFWKSVNFLQNFAHQVRKGEPVQRAAELAGIRTRDTMPSYDQIPEALRRVAARIPGVNVFFQFSWELMRNNVNNAWYAFRDLTSSDGTDRKHGARRLMGIVLGAAAVAAGLEAARRKFGWTDKKDQAFRESFAPEWDKNAVLAPVESMDGGKASYINAKYLIPQMQFGEIFKAFREGRTPGEVFKKVWQTFTDDFVRSNAAVDPALEALSGKRADTGKPISSEQPGSLAAKWDAFNHLMKRIAPGIAQEAGRTRMAITGEQGGYGRKYTMKERLQGLMGLRVNTYDIKQQLNFRLSDLDRQWNEISKRENTESKRLQAMKQAAPDTYAGRIKAIKENAERQRGELQLRAVKLYADAAEVGLTPGDVSKAMNDKRTKLPLDLRLSFIARKLREAGRDASTLTIEELRSIRKGAPVSNVRAPLNPAPAAPE